MSCKNTVALPHYENAIVTMAIKFPEGIEAWKKSFVVSVIERHVEAIQRICADVTGGTPYEFTGDPNALPECGP